MKKIEPKSKAKIQEKTSEITNKSEIAFRMGNIETASDTDCPLTLPHGIGQNFSSQFKSLAPLYAKAIIEKTPNDSCSINNLNTILKGTSKTYARSINNP